jgi:PAS domain S-box-containing protein
MGFFLGLLAAAPLLIGAVPVALWLRHWRRDLLRRAADERAAAQRAVADADAARARAETALRETHAQFQQLLRGRKGCAIFTLDAGGLVLSWGREAEDLFGYSESEIRGRPHSVFYPQAEACCGAADLHLSNARSAGWIDDAGWRVRRDGRTFRAREVLVAGAGGKGFWCLMEDLGGQSGSSAVVPRPDAFATPAPNGARDVMIGLAGDGHITFLNRAFEKATGLARREQLGRPFTTLVHASDWTRVGDLLQRLGEGQSPPSVEARLLAAAGRQVAMELTGTPLGADGAPRGSLILARPQSSRKAAAATTHKPDDQLFQSQKLEALGRLAGGVAHDFNNLLTVILGYADLLVQHGADEHTREVGCEIQKAAERAAALTRQLLAFSRKQLLQPTVLDLNDLVRDLDLMLRRLIGEDVQLTTALHADKLCAKADRGQLEQVLTNLVVNARDAMPQGGRLLISTGQVPASAESTQRTGARGYAMLTVTDSGCGMDEHVLKRLFEPFFTTKDVGKGTGLGLAMAYGIVQQSGGRIDVESKPGCGSTFRVYLPLVDAVAESAQSPPVAALSGDPTPTGAAESGETPEIGPWRLERTPNGRGRCHETVLLVEDEESVRQLARRTLQAQGYRVLEACDGAAALTVCQRHLRSIDIVVTDVVMPQLSGVDLVQRLKAIRPQLKFIYMSGYTDSTVVRHGIVECEANYLQKPFTPDMLTQKVRNLLDLDLSRARSAAE